DYIRYNAFSTYMAQVNTVSNRIKVTWPNQTGYSQQSISNWMGDPNMADYATFYWDVNSDFLPGYMNQYHLLASIGGPYRQKYGYLGANRLAPILSEGAGTSLVYGSQGYTRTLTGCSAGLCTFSSPHGISTVIPFNTRIMIAGSTG